MPMPLTFGAASNGIDQVRGGSPTLDGPPPHMPPRPSGADTAALLGNRPDSDITGGAGLQSPVAQVIAAISMLMNAVNIIQSIVPGRISPQFQIEVQQMAQTLPDAAMQLTQMQSPLGMLSAAAALAPGGMNGKPGAGSMGMGGGAGMSMMSPEPAASPQGVPQRM
jgi:hypothetical protein